MRINNIFNIGANQKELTVKKSENICFSNNVIDAIISDNGDELIRLINSVHLPLNSEEGLEMIEAYNQKDYYTLDRFIRYIRRRTPVGIDYSQEAMEILNSI